MKDEAREAEWFILIFNIGKKENGFYIECGAADGEEGTNTLFFEMNRSWKGELNLTMTESLYFYSIY